MTDQDRAARRAALTRLAVATRERLPEAREDRDAFFRVYLDDLDRFSLQTFVRACRLLETKLDWFPKKHELLEACQAVARQRQHELDSSTKRLTEARQPPVSEEKRQELRDRFNALVGRKVMPRAAAAGDRD